MYPIKTREHEGKSQIWAEIRKKWLVRTPEEEVRQYLLKYMLVDKGVSRSLLSVEREIKYVKLKKRFDVVLFDQEGHPFVLCECKSPQVDLSQEVLYQIARYNATLKAPHLLVTNGVSLVFFSRKDDGTYTFREEGWYE